MAANMQKPEEILAPADFRWPGPKNIAVTFMIAYEGWSEGKAPAIGPMGNPLPPGNLDTNALSWGEYGARRGIWRILKMLSRADVRAGVMVCGVLAERFPDTVKAIADGGHEIIAHSYAMDVLPVLLSEEQERKNIALTTELIEKACGVRPTGWISPGQIDQPLFVLRMIEPPDVGRDGGIERQVQLVPSRRPRR